MTTFNSQTPILHNPDTEPEFVTNISPDMKPELKDRHLYRKLAFISYLAMDRFHDQPETARKASALYLECLTHLNQRPDVEPCHTCECATITPPIEHQNGHGECETCGDGTGFIG